MGGWNMSDNEPPVVPPKCIWLDAEQRPPADSESAPLAPQEERPPLTPPDFAERPLTQERCRLCGEFHNVGGICWNEPPSMVDFTPPDT